MAEPRIFTSVDELKAAVGEQLGYTDWLEIDQKRIDLFAEATGDHQWIHVDPEKAAAGPFGTTIAHGYLTLSLLPLFGPQLSGCHESQVALMYEGGRIQHDVAAALAQSGPRQPPQLLVGGGEQLVAGRRVAGVHLVQ